MKIDAASLKVSADDACGLLKALANPHRLMIVCSLIDGEQSVGALAQQLGVRESLASQHLGLLRRDGLVSARRDAQTIYYALRSGRARALVETLSRLFCTASTPTHS
ncbi:MAG: metalloregulator ArsR/SmtB family transcription factor [Caulobacteraceae bacterium]|nr:metalloregulator ArsR/SmtB family transcription factor [Caulobacteraceae bacterium]